jgi:hypothetical protein
MTDEANFWKPVSDRSAGLTPSDVARWERDRRVRLPAILAQALLLQNGGEVQGVALTIEPLDGFTSLDHIKWDGVWEDRPPTVVDRGRQFYIGESTGVAVVLDYTASSEPRVLLLHHGQGRELRDHGIGSFEELLQVARLDSADSGPVSAPTPAPTPPSSLWVTSVGPNFARVFAVVRRVMGIPPSEAKALLRGPAFRVTAGWPSELRPWREALTEAGATVEIR